MKKALSVDHIIPFRLAREISRAAPSLGLDPNDLKNLGSLCRSHHTKKTAIEVRILRGDVIGFRMEMRCLIGLERTDTALKLYGLLGEDQCSSS